MVAKILLCGVSCQLNGCADNHIVVRVRVSTVLPMVQIVLVRSKRERERALCQHSQKVEQFLNLSLKLRSLALFVKERRFWHQLFFISDCCFLFLPSFFLAFPRSDQIYFKTEVQKSQR